MKKDVIAVVGAGKGGTAILETLLKMPDIVIRHVCDVRPDAPGRKLARERGIAQHGDLELVCRDVQVDLIFEATGLPAVYQKILSVKHPCVRVIGSDDAKIIFHLLDRQQGVADTLGDYNQELDRRVQERTRELAQANETLQQINNEKTRYLMHATHQLKAPFAAIQSHIDLILEGYVGRIEPRTREIILKMQQRCMLLSEAIKEMLELANLKSLVRENIRMEEAELEGIIASAVRHFADLAAARKIRLVIAAAPRLRVVCNRNQILILLSTLLENAIHYSPEGSEIRIAAAGPPDSEQVEVSVQDRGIGIEKQVIGRIFDEYFRANAAVAVHEQGTGLGLAIAREIANIHGTTIRVESAPGQGATFSFRLKAPGGRKG
jgi:signal transduction histidine kinase